LAGKSATIACPYMNYVDVLCRLIEFDTSAADGTGCRAAMAFLTPLFQEVGCEVVHVDIPREAAG